MKDLQTLVSVASREEAMPPHLCLSATEDGMCCEELPRALRPQQHQESPKSVSLMDVHEEDELYRFEASHGSIEVEIGPHLAARLDEYDDYDFYHNPGNDNESSSSSSSSSSCASIMDPPESGRRRSLSTFPSHLPFPSLDTPPRCSNPSTAATTASDDSKKGSSTASTTSTTTTTTTAAAPIEPKLSSDRSQWILESLQRLDDGAEERRRKSAASVGIDSILSAMRQHRTNDRVQRYGCGALQKLASQSETNRALISNAGGVMDLLAAMEHHPDRASIQECACHALSSLSKAANGNAYISQFNGIETILRAMRRHRSHEGVQKNACLVLLGLACSSSIHNTAIARLGGMEDIMEAMSSHKGSSPGIMEYGSAALWSLAYMNSQNGEAIEKAGGLDAIFEVLNSTDNEQAPSMSQEDQCMLVINKQKTGESEDKEFEGQGVDAILSVFVRPFEFQ